ncbi:mannose-6-phosphate isomerase-like protein (cupin superfamily) [Methylobacterium sp. PvP117]
MELASVEELAAKRETHAASSSDPFVVTVLDSSDTHPTLRIVRGAGEVKILSWPGNGAQHRSLHLLRLEDGAATIPLQHPSESVYYVIDGGGAVTDAGTGERFELTGGSIVHVGPGDTYHFDAGVDGLSIVGGPCPPDPNLYKLIAFPGETA